MFVEMHFMSQELIHYVDGVFVDKPIQQLRDEYRLDRMRYLPRLEEVVLRGPRGASSGHATLQAIAAFLRREFAVRGKVLRVKVNR
jgi:hypothetical protein